MNISCRKCGEGISAENINIQRMVASCAACDTVFDFSDQLGNKDNFIDTRSVPQPDGISIDNNGSQLLIKWRWFSPIAFFYLLFSLFWNGIMLAMGGSMIFGAIQSGNWWMAGGVFLIPHVWIGIGMAYFTLSLFLNSTEVSADYDTLSIKHGPLPWFGNKRIERHSILQLYSKEGSNWNKRGNWNQGNFELHAVTDKNKQTKLLRGLKSSEYPLFIESAVEGFLGIDDSPVRGEIAR